MDAHRIPVRRGREMFYLMMLPLVKFMQHGWLMNEICVCVCVCVEIGVMVLAEEVQSMWKIICLTDAFSTTNLMQTGLGLSPTTCGRGQ
jgi:hypothetical protein